MYVQEAGAPVLVARPVALSGVTVAAARVGNAVGNEQAEEGEQFGLREIIILSADGRLSHLRYIYIYMYVYIYVYIYTYIYIYI